MAYKIDKKRKEFVEEFEHMRYMAELRALSKISLERPLSKEEFNRMDELARKLKIK